MPFWANPEINLFWDWDFSTFFIIIWFKSTKMKLRPYFTMELVHKLMKNTLKYLIYSPLTEKVLTEWLCINKTGQLVEIWIDEKSVPGNLCSCVGFITCLRGKFEDEWRVARVLSPLLHQMQVTQPPPPTRAVDPERGKQGGERWAESNNISTPNNHIFYLFVYTVCTFKAFFVCLVVAFEAEKTAASWQVSEWYNISLIFFPPAQSLQL